MAAQSKAEAAILNRERVLHRLDQLSRKAEEQGQYSAAARCEELIGRALGIFVDKSEHTFTWDGDPAKLTEPQLEKVIQWLEAMAPEQPKRPALPPGDVIDVEALPPDEPSGSTSEAPAAN